jgi:predicted transcriptional regulator with HTH domain
MNLLDFLEKGKDKILERIAVRGIGGTRISKGDIQLDFYVKDQDIIIDVNAPEARGLEHMLSSEQVRSKWRNVSDAVTGKMYQYDANKSYLKLEVDGDNNKARMGHRYNRLNNSSYLRNVSQMLDDMIEVLKAGNGSSTHIPFGSAHATSIGPVPRELARLLPQAKDPRQTPPPRDLRAERTLEFLAPVKYDSPEALIQAVSSGNIAPYRKRITFNFDGHRADVLMNDLGGGKIAVRVGNVVFPSAVPESRDYTVTLHDREARVKGRYPGGNDPQVMTQAITQAVAYIREHKIVKEQ